MRKKFILQGLDCAHCAQKIVEQIKKENGVTDVDLNFTTKTLVIDADENKVFEKAKKIVVEIEPDVKVKEFGEVTEDDEQFSAISLVLILMGVGLFVASNFVEISLIKLIFTSVSYILVSHKILINLLKKLKRFDFFDENFLMVVASTGALIIGETFEGMAVVLLFQIGEFLQSKAVGKSRKSITELMNIKPETARLVKDGFEAQYEPEKIKVGSVIKVLPGEKIPLDGVVLTGEGSVDKSALTGESVPYEFTVGDELLSGSINKTSVITLKVTKEYSVSTVAKILELVENASSKKAKTEKFITKFAKVYTPIVVAVAVLLAITGALITGDVSEWIYRALSFLVVSCPCSLVLSIPLVYFCAIGAGAKNGVLIKGSNVLEALEKIKTVIFDKTGTITTGEFKIDEVFANEGVDKNILQEYAAAAESISTHPIAKAVSDSFRFDASKITDGEEIAASSVRVTYDSHTVLVGSKRLMAKENINFIPNDKNGVYVAIDGEYAGFISLADSVKKEVKQTIKALKKRGIEKTIMLTGDSETSAKSVAKQIEIDEYHHSLLPKDKADFATNEMKHSCVAFVGDGINDAPVLALSHVGFSCGQIGSQSAIEASDIVLMQDSISGVDFSLSLAKRAKAIVKQNIVFSLGVKAIIMLLSALGVAGIMWAAVFADVGVALVAVLNSMRVLKAK